MRYGLLALSIAMLASGGVAAQSALSISDSAVPVSAERTLAGSGAPVLLARADAVEFPLR